jgi:outer membrane protein
MNKIKLFAIVTVLVASIGSASAQKSGYISLDQVVSLMPEIGKIDTLLQRYQADSLNPQFAYMVAEYNRKDSMISTKDSVKYQATVRNQVRQELEGLAYQIQNWQGIVQNAMQNKQSQLLEPVYRKAMNALNAAAKENGYSYVYNKEALLVAPPADDLLPLVAKKLNIKLPATTAPAAAVAPKK